MDTLRWMRQRSVIQDDKYWDIKLDGDIVLPNPYRLKLSRMVKLQTNQDVRIELRFDYSISTSLTGVHVEVYIPKKTIHPLLVSIIEDDYRVSWIHNYDEFRRVYLELLSSSSKTHLCFFLQIPLSADLSKPLDIQSPSLPINGPVQMLDFSRRFITTLKREETRFLSNKKTREVDMIREELMRKACHPKRVAAWIEQGFDPFQ